MRVNLTLVSGTRVAVESESVNYLIDTGATTVVVMENGKDFEVAEEFEKVCEKIWPKEGK